MDVRFTPEQDALRSSVALVVDRLGPRAVGELADRERAAKLDAAVAAAGWRELRAADDGGRPWASAVEVAIIAEELARGLADAPFLGPTLAADLRRAAGALPVAGPETVVLTDDLSELARDDAGGVAIDAAGSDRALVLVADGDAWMLGSVALPTDADGIDLTRPCVAVATGDAVPVPDQTARLRAHDIARWSALALAATCADLVGAMRGAIDLAVAHASERRQFGTTIGSFQAVQHLLADAAVHMEGSRSAARHAAWAVDALAANDALAAAAGAKAYCARAALAVGEIAIQVHGGIGNTWECLAHVYLRRALLAADVLGAVGVNLGRVLEHNGIGCGDGLR